MADRIPKSKIKKNDQIKVTAGKDKGKTGRVLRVDHKSGRVLVEGINMVRKAVRQRQQNERGGIIEVEAPIHISNVMVLTKDGRPTRIGYTEKNGQRVRIAKKTGEEL
jgi:large subunit ribosomal protein L24